MSNILKILCLIICFQIYGWSKNLLIGIKGGINSVLIPPALHGWGLTFSGKQMGFEIDYCINFLHLGTGFTYQSNRLEKTEWQFKRLQLDYIQVDLVIIGISYSILSLKTGLIFQKGLFDFESPLKTAVMTFIESEIRPRIIRSFGILFAYRPVFHFNSEERFIDYYGGYLSFGLNYTF